jgi:hypothetical protein
VTVSKNRRAVGEPESGGYVSICFLLFRIEYDGLTVPQYLSSLSLPVRAHSLRSAVEDFDGVGIYGTHSQPLWPSTNLEQEIIMLLAQDSPLPTFTTARCDGNLIRHHEIAWGNPD